MTVIRMTPIVPPPSTPRSDEGSSGLGIAKGKRGPPAVTSPAEAGMKG